MADDLIIPEYYTKGGMDVLNIMRLKFSKEQVKGFLIGCVLKYIFRYQNKNGKEDLIKIKWYIEELIKEENDNN